MQEKKLGLKNSFKDFKLSHKNSIISQIAESTTEIQCQTLSLILGGLGSSQLQNENMGIIIKYLKLTKDSAQDLFALFLQTSLNNLTTLAYTLEVVHQRDKNQFVVLVEAVISENKTVIEFLTYITDNKIVSIGLDVLLFLMQQSLSMPINNLLATLKLDNMGKYAESIKKLALLNIKPMYLEEWQVVHELPKGWFNQKKIKWNIALHSQVFTPYGFHYLLKYFEPHDLTDVIIQAINHLIDCFIGHSNAEDNWQDLDNRFFKNNNAIKVTLSRISQVFTMLTEDECGRKNLKAFLKSPLLQSDNFFQDKDFSQLIKLFLKFHPNLYCEEGVALYRRIQLLGYEISEDYISALNTIIAKPQLQYISVLNDLSDRWFTEMGLVKLGKFFEKYLSPEGLRFISNLDVEHLSKDEIDEVNKFDRDLLIKQFSNGNITQKKLTNLIPRLTYLNNAITLLKEYAPSTREINANTLINGDCAITEEKLISDQVVDSPIIFIPQDRLQPFTYTELNEAFCFITKGKEYLICDRKVLKNWKSKDNAVDLFDNSKKFSEESIVDLCEQNLDIDVINRYFFGDRNIEDKIERTSMLEQLRTSPILNDIPEIIFAEEGRYLTTLNLRYIKNDLMFSFLIMLGQAMTAADQIHNLNIYADQIYDKFSMLILPSRVMEIPKAFFATDFTLLLSLDNRYFSHDGMFTYLKRYIKEKVCSEDIQKLNNIADSMFHKLSKHANIVSILLDMPDKFFTPQLFQPDIFVCIHDEWLEHSSAKEFLKILYEYITPYYFKEGLTMMTNDVEFVGKAFETMSDEKLFEIYKDLRLLDIVNTNIDSAEKLFPHFIKLLDKFKSIELKLIEDLQGTTDIYDAVYQRLYTYICSERLSISDSIFTSLRKRVKRNLLPKELIFEKLDSFKVLLNGQLDNFKNKLKNFEQSEMKGVGQILCTNAHKTAYQAITQALSHEETAFVDLRETIKLQEANLSVQEVKILNRGLLPKYTAEFSLEADHLVNEELPLVHRECLRDPNKLRVALLDDFFYKLLDEAKIVDYVVNHQSVFFNIMETYRPNELKAIAQYDVDGISIGKLYRKYKNLPDEVIEATTATKTIIEMPPVANAKNPSGNGIDFNLTKTPEGDVAPHKNSPPPTVIKASTATQINKQNTSNKKSLNWEFFNAINDAINIFKTIVPPSAVKKVEYLKRGPSVEFEYQLTDYDLSNGIRSIRDGGANNGQYVFLPPGNLSENHKADKASSLDGIRIAVKNKGKIIFGIMNINSVHYIAVILYTGKEADAVTQVIILDPSYNDAYSEFSKDVLVGTKQIKVSSFKLNNVHEIEEKFKKEGWEVKPSPFISQQLNGFDCGVSCLQVGEDLVKRQLVTIENGQLTFHEDRLTLHGESFLDQTQPEIQFSEFMKKTRDKWEAILNNFKEVYQIYSDGSPDGSRQDYNFESNKRVQFLISICNRLLSQIWSDFFERQDNPWGEIVESSYTLNEFLNKAEKLISGYIETNPECTKYGMLIKEALDLHEKYPNEHLRINEKSIQENLLTVMSEQFFHKKCRDFNQIFFKYLKENGVIKDRNDNKFPSNLLELYQQFLESNQNEKVWIQYFEAKNKKESHYVLLQPALKKYISKINQANDFARPYGLRHDGPPDFTFNSQAFKRIRSRSSFSNNPNLNKLLDGEPKLLSQSENKLSANNSQAAPKPEEPHTNTVINPFTKKPSLWPEQPQVPQDTLSNDVKSNGKTQTRRVVIRDYLKSTLAPKNDSQPLSDTNSLEKAKEFIKAHLQSLIEELKKYPEKGVSSTARSRVKAIKSDCERWLIWLSETDDINLLNKQFCFIANDLYQKTKEIFADALKNKKSNLDNLPDANLLLKPVAKLVGVSDSDIELYNTSKTLEINVKPLKSAEKEPTFVKREIGYNWLLNSIGIKIVKIKETYKLENVKLEDLSEQPFFKRLGITL